ncbi:hypothetical protein ABT369_25740 [Dactylosporangium sp. NPDC000244]|uniref:hypothetical protein n=1 Tax=Dactylosporangium sp. NPDC000244 TaxID=3154365 RepID=UPI0033303054
MVDVSEPGPGEPGPSNPGWFGAWRGRTRQHDPEQGHGTGFRPPPSELGQPEPIRRRRPGAPPPSAPPARQRAQLSAELHGMRDALILIPLADGWRDQVGDRIDELSRALANAGDADLPAVARRIEGLGTGFFVWRQLLQRVGHRYPSADPVAGRPDWYTTLIDRAITLRPRLAYLPTDERDAAADPGAPPPARHLTRDTARNDLHHAVGRLEAAMLAAEHADERPPWLLTADPDALQAEQAAARQALTRLLDEIGSQADARGTPVARPLEPPNAAGRPWTPRERFAPPLHLVAPEPGQRPALGTEAVGRLTPSLMARIRADVIATLPDTLRQWQAFDDGELGGRYVPVPSVQAILDRQLDELTLLDHIDELITDRWTFDVAGHQVTLQLDLGQGDGEWEQSSDAIEVRLKDTTNRRDRAQSALGHQTFLDTTVNLAYILDNSPALVRRHFTNNEAYVGLGMIVWKEHEEARLVTSELAAERTIKTSSYVAYEFLFDVTVRVTVASPGSWTPWRWPSTRTNAATAAPVARAVPILVSRESARPIDDAARRFSPAIHPDYTAPAYKGPKVPGRPVHLPRNSGVEAFTATRQLREFVETFAAQHAKASTPQRRRIGAALTARQVKAQVHRANDLGAELIFGHLQGQAPDGVVMSMTLTDPVAVVEMDPKTWADFDDQVSLSFNTEQVAADAHDVPPGLFLFTMVWENLLGHLEPYFFLWPTVDAVFVRSGAGESATQLSGVRFTGERTSVVRFTVEVALTLTSKPGAEPAVLRLDRSLYVRMLREDAKQLIDLPILEGDVGSASVPVPALRYQDLRRLHPVMRISELALAPAAGTPGPAGQALLRQALDLLRKHHPGIVPQPDGRASRHSVFLAKWMDDARMAVENIRTLRAKLSNDNLAAQMHLLLSSHGYAFRLTRSTVTSRFGDEVVVRVWARQGILAADGSTATFAPARHTRWLPLTEMDANVTSSQDLTTSWAVETGYWTGLHVMHVFETLKTTVLKSTQFRPIGLGKQAWATGMTAGTEVSGMQGLSIDEAGEFTAPVVLFLRIESAGKAASGDGSPTLPVPPALPLVRTASPLPASMTAMVPADFTDIQQPDTGTWVPYSLAHLPPSVPALTGADGGPLVFRPTPARPLPRDTRMMLSADDLLRTVVDAVTAMGYKSIAPAARIELEQALAVAMMTANDLLPSPDAPAGHAKQIWSGEIVPTPLTSTATGWSVSASVTAKLTFSGTDGLTTFGVANGYGTYTDLGVSSTVAVQQSKTGGLWPALRVRFPLAIDQHLGSWHIDHFNYQPQLGQRRELTRTSEESITGTTGRMQLDISWLALAEVGAHLELQIETWVNHNPVGHTLSWMGGRADRRQRRSASVPVTGIAGLASADATELGLLPPALRLRYDRSVGYRIPPQLSFGLDHGGLQRAPDLNVLVDRLTASVEQRYGPLVAAAAEQELGKLRGFQGATAALIAMFDQLSITVPVRSYLRATTPRVGPLPIKLGARTFRPALPPLGPVPLVPATRTLRFTIRATPIQARYLGLSTHHNLGRRDDVEVSRTTGEMRRRRLIFDPVRGWFVTGGPLVNSAWLHPQAAFYGQTTRTLSDSRVTGNTIATTLDTGSSAPAAVVEELLRSGPDVTAATAALTTYHAATDPLYDAVRDQFRTDLATLPAGLQDQLTTAANRLVELRRNALDPQRWPQLTPERAHRRLSDLVTANQQLEDLAETARRHRFARDITTSAWQQLQPADQAALATRRAALRDSPDVDAVEALALEAAARHDVRRFNDIRAGLLADLERLAGSAHERDLIDRGRQAALRHEDHLGAMFAPAGRGEPLADQVATLEDLTDAFEAIADEAARAAGTAGSAAPSRRYRRLLAALPAAPRIGVGPPALPTPAGTVHNGRAGTAVFDVKLRFDADVTMDTAPAAWIDAVTLGATQTGESWTVDPYVPSEPARMKFDPRLLDPAPAGPDRYQTIGPLPPPPVPAGPPREPIRRIDASTPLHLLTDRRPTTFAHPRRLEQVRLAGFGPDDLKALRALAATLAVPRGATAGSRWGTVPAALANHIWNAPPGASWFHPRAVLQNQIDAIVNAAFLAGRGTDLITTGVQAPMLLGNRFSRPVATLELLAGVEGIWPVRIVDDVKSRRFTGGSSATTADTDATAGHQMLPWMLVDYPLVDWKYYDPASDTNAMGPLLGMDVIGSANQRSRVRGRAGHSRGVKTTGDVYIEVYLRVRWHVALSPRDSSWFGPHRQLLRDSVVRDLKLLVPAEVMPALLDPANWRGAKPTVGAPPPSAPPSAPDDILDSGRLRPEDRPMPSIFAALEAPATGVTGPGASVFPRADPAPVLARVAAAPPRRPTGLVALDRWLAAPDAGESRRRFAALRADLTAGPATAALADLAARHPYDDWVAAHAALLRLAGSGLAEAGYDYLAEPEPVARQARLFRLLTADRLALLPVFAELTRGAADLPGGPADAVIVRAVRAAVGDGAMAGTAAVDGGTPVAEVRAVRGSVGPRLRVGWVRKLIVELAPAAPSGPAGLRRVAATLVDC